MEYIAAARRRTQCAVRHRRPGRPRRRLCEASPSHFEGHRATRQARHSRKQPPRRPAPQGSLAPGRRLRGRRARPVRGAVRARRAHPPRPFPDERVRVPAEPGRRDDAPRSGPGRRRRHGGNAARAGRRDVAAAGARPGRRPVAADGRRRLPPRARPQRGPAAPAQPLPLRAHDPARAGGGVHAVPPRRGPARALAADDAGPGALGLVPHHARVPRADAGRAPRRRDQGRDLAAEGRAHPLQPRRTSPYSTGPGSRPPPAPATARTAKPTSASSASSRLRGRECRAARCRAMYDCAQTAASRSRHIGCTFQGGTQ